MTTWLTWLRWGRNLLAACFVITTAVCNILAQSTDPTAPTPLTSNPLTGAINAQDNGSYYYTFRAGPGTLTVSVPVRTNGSLSQLTVEIINGDGTVMASFDATSSGIVQEQKIFLPASQPLLLKLTGLSMNDSGSFTIKLKGAVSLGIVASKTVKTTAVDEPQNGGSAAAVNTHPSQPQERFSLTHVNPEPAPKDVVGPAVAGRYHALLIAVQDYADPSMNLNNPVRDASKLQEILTQGYTFEPEDVVLLKNPTREQIFTAFEQLEHTLKPEDSLLVFYAGHGFWDEKARQGYWIPQDVRRESRAKMLSNADVRDSIRSIAVRHTLLISDACFSGGILKSRGMAPPVTPAIEQLERMPSRTAMTSGALTTVPDRSIFLEYLVKRLQENKQAYETATELFASLQTAVINNSPVMDANGNRPSPLYGIIQEAGDEGGDFVFVRRH